MREKERSERAGEREMDDFDDWMIYHLVYEQDEDYEQDESLGELGNNIRELNNNMTRVNQELSNLYRAFNDL